MLVGKTGGNHANRPQGGNGLLSLALMAARFNGERFEVFGELSSARQS